LSQYTEMRSRLLVDHDGRIILDLTVMGSRAVVIQMVKFVVLIVKVGVMLVIAVVSLMVFIVVTIKMVGIVVMI